MCNRWRPITDFGVRAWDDDSKTIVKYLHSYCSTCKRIQSREYHRLASARARARVKSGLRANARRRRRQAGAKEIGPRVLAEKKPGSVRREPFAEWLQNKIDNHGMKAVSFATELNPRQIRSIVNGYDKSGKASGHLNHSKTRAIDWVQIETVERALLNWGEDHDMLDDLYPSSEID